MTKFLVKFLILWLEQSSLPPVQEALSTHKKRNVQRKRYYLGTSSAAPLELMKLSDAWSTMKCDVSEEFRLMELEVGAGVMFPVLGASLCICSTGPWIWNLMQCYQGIRLHCHSGIFTLVYPAGYFGFHCASCE